MPSWPTTLPEADERNVTLGQEVLAAAAESA